MRDYVYDIGPESCIKLKEEIEQADLLFVWGTAGMIADTCMYCTYCIVRAVKHDLTLNTSHDYHEFYSFSSGLCEVSSFQTGQKCLIAAACSKSTASSTSLSNDNLRSVTAGTPNMSPNDSLKNRTAGRAESSSLITISSDSGDITLQKKGKADLSSTTTSESVDLEPKVELKQKRGKIDSAAPKGRADSAATPKSTDIDMRHKRKSFDPPHTVAPNADDITTSAASVPVALTRTILIGESTVEWFSRILDPDGESEGDIVGMGKVAFASRNSNVRL